jgi:hypothetical protein
LFNAITILVSSNVAALDAHAMLVDDDETEHEIAIEYLNLARATGEFIHPETGEPIEDFESKVFPFFRSVDQFYVGGVMKADEFISFAELRCRFSASEPDQIRLDGMFASSHEERLNAVNRAIDWIVLEHSKTRQHHHKRGEDALSIDVVTDLKALAFQASARFGLTCQPD